MENSIVVNYLHLEQKRQYLKNCEARIQGVMGSHKAILEDLNNNDRHAEYVRSDSMQNWTTEYKRLWNISRELEKEIYTLCVIVKRKEEEIAKRKEEELANV